MSKLFEYFSSLERRRQQLPQNNRQLQPAEVPFKMGRIKLQSQPGSSGMRLMPPPAAPPVDDVPNPFAPVARRVTDDRRAVLTPDSRTPPPDVMTTRRGEGGRGISLNTPPPIVPVENGNIPLLAPPPMDELSIKNQQMANLNDTQGKRMLKNKVVNNDRGVWGRIKDIGREAIIGAGAAYGQGRAQGLNADEALRGSIGGAVAGGLMGGFNPSIDEQRKRAGEIAAKQNEIKLLQDQRLYQSEQQKAAQEAMNAQIKGTGLGLENIDKVEGIKGKRIGNETDLYKLGNMTAEEAIFSAKADDIVTPEESAVISAKYNRDVPTFDRRKLKEKEVEGKSFVRPELGSQPYIENKSLPVERREVPIIQTLSNGVQIFTTGDKAVDREISENYRQASMDMEAGKFNIEQMKSYETALTSWSEKENTRQQQGVQLANDGNSKINQSYDFLNQSQAAEQEAQTLEARALQAEQQGEQEKKDGYSGSAAFKLAGEVQGQARAQRAKANELKTSASRLKEEGNSLLNQSANSKPSPQPKRPTGGLTAPTLSGQRFTETQLRERMKTLGKTKPQIRKKIEEARAGGLLK